MQLSVGSLNPGACAFPGNPDSFNTNCTNGTNDTNNGFHSNFTSKRFVVDVLAALAPSR